MSINNFYHTGKIYLSKDSTNWVGVSFGNANVSVNPEYITHKNILLNEINILKGYSLEIELELFLLSSDLTNYGNVAKIIEILNATKTLENGIYGYQKNIWIGFKSVAVPTLFSYTESFDKLSSDVKLTDYVINNLTIGQKIQVKLNKSSLISQIPVWRGLTSSYTNNVNNPLGVDYIVALDY